MYKFIGNEMSVLPLSQLEGIVTTVLAEVVVQSSGELRVVPMLARVALAVGCSTPLVETHQDPDNATYGVASLVPIK